MGSRKSRGELPSGRSFAPITGLHAHLVKCTPSVVSAMHCSCTETPSAFLCTPVYISINRSPSGSAVPEKQP